MTAPRATALQQPPGRVSRFSGRPVATRANGLPIWTKEPSQPRVASPRDDVSNLAGGFEAAAGTTGSAE